MRLIQALMDRNFTDKKLIVFDLDGTLAESKSAIDSSMSDLLGKLLQNKLVAVIGGGSFEQFKLQLLDHLGVPPALLSRLSLFPTTATSFYRYENNSWHPAYQHQFSLPQIKMIMEAFHQALPQSGFVPLKKTYGMTIENRGSQITWSALGQEAPVEEKKAWLSEHADVRKKLAELLQVRLPDMEVKEGGITSIDVTQKGIDKKYGIQQIQKYLAVPLSQMLFIGDATFAGGNDEPATRAGESWLHVSGPAQTKEIIRKILSS